MDDHKATDDIVLVETKYVRLVARDGWVFLQRTVCTGIVCIVPVTRDGQIILIEQYRAPLRRSIIEFPAGLAGDQSSPATESLDDAARRELLEETGYAAGALRRVVDTASSAGLTDEIITFYVADRVEKAAAGGGVEGESIQVHVVPLSTVDEWLRTQTAAGKLVDARVYSGLYFLAAAVRDKGSG